MNFFLAFVGSLALGMTWLASPLPGYLCDRVGCRITNFIGGTLCVTGLVLTSFSQGHNLMYFTHSLVFGFGVCFIYNCSYLVIAQYFKENLSMATGIVHWGQVWVCYSQVHCFKFFWTHLDGEARTEWWLHVSLLSAF